MARLPITILSLRFVEVEMDVEFVEAAQPPSIGARRIRLQLSALTWRVHECRFFGNPDFFIATTSV